MTFFRSFLFLGIFFLGIGTVHAQKNKTVDKAILHLYDGSVYIGKIVEESNLYLKIIGITDDTINVNKVYIKRLRRSNKNILLHSGGKYHFTKGPFYSLQFGGGIVDDGNGQDGTQVDFIAGYRFNNKYSAGLGIGVSEQQSNVAQNFILTNSIPVFAYGRFYPWDKRVRPYVDTKIGWGFPNQNAFGAEHKGGTFFQPGIGLHFASKRNIRFLISLSQMLHNTRGENINFDAFGNRILSKFSFWYNRTIFKVAIEWR